MAPTSPARPAERPRVAKQVTLHAVRVLNCQGSGTTSGVIAGVDWVTANHASSAVANMRLGGGVSTSLDNAVSNSINSGVSYAIAVGQLEHQRVQLVTRPRRSGQHRRRDDQHRRALLVLQLRDVPRHLRPGLEHHIGLEHEQHRDEHDQRNLDGTPHVTGAIALYLQDNPGARRPT
jgi:subtilisin family serine protease